MKEKISNLTKKMKHTPVGEELPSGRVTNETVAEHREAVLKGARRYIYPLQHTKHRLVVITVTLVVVGVLGFISYCSYALYQAKTSSDFMYKVTKVIPFPIARISSEFVPYEHYLFEIKHYTHYYENQQE